jgi:hypothetical protein
MALIAREDSSDSEEKQLCTSCTTPNDPAAHFCAKCGAPLSSFATIAPFERLFAEGFIYRQAAERPRKLIVVLGVWLIFGTMASFGLMIIGMSQSSGLEAIIGLLAGGAVVVFSMVMIWKSTQNYCSRKKAAEKRDS